MIIIEGSDLVGKTTLAKALEVETGYVYQHLSRLPDNFDRYWGYISLMGPQQIRDRFHMSEVVYAECRYELPKLRREVYRLIDAQLALLGTTTVVLTASSETIASRWRDGEMYDLEFVQRANKTYQLISGPSAFDYSYIHFDLHFCVDDVSLADMVKYIWAHQEAKQGLIHTLAARKPTTI